MPRISKKKYHDLVILSVSLGIAMISYVFVSKYIMLPLYLSTDIVLILAVIISIFPLGIAHLFNMMWRRGVDRNIPKLLRQIAEAGRIGVSIPQALEISARYDFGPLTPLLRKSVTKLSWGYSIDDVINDLIEEIGTPTARRAFNLVLEANKSGGDIEEMFMILQSHLSGIQLALRERMALMKPYISYGYIAFFTFMAIQIILLKSFFLPIINVGKSAGSFSIFKISIDINTLKILFYHISLIEAVISGLVSGKMGEGTIFAGLKHVAILLSSTIITYYMLVFV